MAASDLLLLNGAYLRAVSAMLIRRAVYMGGGRQFAVRGQKPNHAENESQARRPDTTPSDGTQPLAGSDVAVSQGQKSNDFGSPPVTRSAILFPVPN